MSSVIWRKFIDHQTNISVSDTGWSNNVTELRGQIVYWNQNLSDTLLKNLTCKIIGLMISAIISTSCSIFVLCLARWSICFEAGVAIATAYRIPTLSYCIILHVPVMKCRRMLRSINDVRWARRVTSPGNRWRPFVWRHRVTSDSRGVPEVWY